MVWLHAMPHEDAPDGMTNETWQQQGFSCTKFYGYCLEDAPFGVRKPNIENYGRPTIKHVHFDGNGVEYVFSNCLCCRKKDFSGNYKTPANGTDVPIDYKDAPRLGRCGCVVCTGCYLEKKKQSFDQDEEWMACPSPSCNRAETARSHHRDEVIWIMNEKVISCLAPLETKTKENEPRKGAGRKTKKNKKQNSGK